MTPPAEAEEAVDMYFRKMAQVSLLTREGEVELARRIEEGERRIIGAIVDSAFAASELDHIGQLLYKGKLKVRDVVRNVDDEDAFALAAASCRSTYPRRNPMNEPFPTAVGESLRGERVELPGAFHGAPVVLLVGYLQESQFDIDRWRLGLSAIVDIPFPWREAHSSRRIIKVGTAHGAASMAGCRDSNAHVS